MKSTKVSTICVSRWVKVNHWLAVFLLLSLWAATSLPSSLAQGSRPRTTVTEKSVRKYMNALASDEMRGRGSATADELRAAEYIASQLKALKIKPAGDNGGYLQSVKFQRRPRGTLANAPATEATTTNVVGIIRGVDRQLSKETILL